MTVTQTSPLICAFTLDGKGGGQALGWEKVQSLQQTPQSKLKWVHLNHQHKETKPWLVKQGLSESIVQALCAKESRPRTFIQHDGLYLCLRGVNLNPGSAPEDMISIRVWATKNFIVTTQYRHLRSADELAEELTAGVGPIDVTDFILELSHHLIDHTAEVIDNLDERIDDLENEIESTPSFTFRSAVSDLRRQAIMMRRFLVPQRDALNRLFTEKLSWTSENSFMQFREIGDSAIKLIEDLDEAKDRLVVTQESLMTLAQEQMNRKMYLLAIVAAIFLPLSFVTGLLGINVGGIPGANVPYAFAVVCGILVIVAIFLVYFFRRGRWL